MKKELTEESVRKFGAGDQFHLFLPETGGRIVASIDAIKLDSGKRELRVEFGSAIELDGDGARTEADPGWYYEANLTDLSVAEEEEGHLCVPNPGAEHVLLFFKPGHRGFIAV